MTTPITLGHEDDNPSQKGVMFESQQKLIDDMLRVSDGEKVRAWVKERLMSLHEYELERDSLTQKESDN